MILYTNGCSHSTGFCINTIKSWPNLVMKNISKNSNYLINPILNSINIKQSFLLNESSNGAGNDYIFHRSLETITKLINYNIPPDYVIIQWSGPNRRMHYTKDGKFIFVNLNDDSDFGIKFEPIASTETLHYMFSLQQFLKSKNIKYLFFNYIGLATHIKHNPIYYHLDFDNIVDFGIDDILENGLLEYIKSNNMNCDNPGHPNEIGNHFIANHITHKLGYDTIRRDDKII